MPTPFSANLINNKKVLITGNTGFKGGWLTLFLQSLGAEVYGLSLNGSQSIFNIDSQKQYYTDIRNYDEVYNVIQEVQPDIIFHLAANAITLNSYLKPRETFNINVMGTVNVLDALRDLNRECSVVVISSDKCYENKEWVWGYRENDNLGGKDPYSASKSMTEIVSSSYYHSFFCKNSKISIVSCRAGNVIGGGDWGDQRIIPDCIKAWRKKEAIEIRNPSSIRPWSYVLDIIYGYTLAAIHAKEFSGDSFNFGPSTKGVTVKNLVLELSKYWPDQSFNFIRECEIDIEKKESNILRLNSDKAFHLLGWNPSKSMSEGVKETLSFYLKMNASGNNNDLANSMVNEYINSLS